MFDNYRQKSVFKRLSDESLHDYVEALACPDPKREFELCYSPEWEAQIYLTGMRAIDLEIWRQLPNLKPPLLIIRGARTNTFWESTASFVERHPPKCHG